MSRQGGASARRAGRSAELLVKAAADRYAAMGRAYLRHQHPEFVGRRSQQGGTFTGSYRERAGVDFVGMVNVVVGAIVVTDPASVALGPEGVADPAGLARTHQGRPVHFPPFGEGIDARQHVEAQWQAVPIGRACYIEVKSSGGASIPLTTNKKPTLKPQQAAELKAAHNMGAISGVLVRVHSTTGGVKTPHWYWLDWPAWRGAEAGARADGASSLSRARLEELGTEVPLGGGPWDCAPDFLPALQAGAVSAPRVSDWTTVLAVSE